MCSHLRECPCRDFEYSERTFDGFLGLLNYYLLSICCFFVFVFFWGGGGGGGSPPVDETLSLCLSKVIALYHHALFALHTYIDNGDLFL